MQCTCKLLYTIRSQNSKSSILHPLFRVAKQKEKAKLKMLQACAANNTEMCEVLKIYLCYKIIHYK